MSDFLSNDFRNFSCCSGGSFRNFTEDAVQTSSWIIAGDADFKTIAIGIADASRFVVGNIVEVKGDVYNGNFEVVNVMQRGGNTAASIFLETPFLKNSPTAQKNAGYQNGYVDTSVHSVKNITMFSPLVLEYAEYIRNTKGKKAGGKDNYVYYSRPVLGDEGIIADAYRVFEKHLGKKGISVAEFNYLKVAADTAIATIKDNPQRRNAADYFNKKYTKLKNPSILMPSSPTDEAGKKDPPSPTPNDSLVAQAGRGDTGGTGTGSGAGVSISGANMGKYLFLGVAAIGAFFLIRSIVKKQ